MVKGKDSLQYSSMHWNNRAYIILTHGKNQTRIHMASARVVKQEVESERRVGFIYLFIYLFYSYGMMMTMAHYFNDVV